MAVLGGMSSGLVLVPPDLGPDTTVDPEIERERKRKAALAAQEAAGISTPAPPPPPPPPPEPPAAPQPFPGPIRAFSPDIPPMPQLPQLGEVAPPPTPTPAVANPLHYGVGDQYQTTTPYGQKGSLWTLGYHPGVDYAMPMNTPVPSADAGTVERVGRDNEYGNYVWVKHPWGTSVYGHLNRADVRVGDTVGQGQEIGLSGSTGKSTGPHLHFETRVNGAIVNPSSITGTGASFTPGLPQMPNIAGQAPETLGAGQYTPPVGPDNLRAAARAAALAEGVDPGLFEQLVGAESTWNPMARSAAGAMGLTGLMPGTAAAMGVRDPYDVQQNLRGGAKYLKQQLDMFGGNTAQALAAYNTGPGNVMRGNIPQETLGYVQKILGGLTGVAQAIARPFQQAAQPTPQFVPPEQPIRDAGSPFGSGFAANRALMAGTTSMAQMRAQLQDAINRGTMTVDQANLILNNALDQANQRIQTAGSQTFGGHPVEDTNPPTPENNPFINLINMAGYFPAAPIPGSPNIRTALGAQNVATELLGASPIGQVWQAIADPFAGFMSQGLRYQAMIDMATQLESQGNVAGAAELRQQAEAMRRMPSGKAYTEASIPGFTGLMHEGINPLNYIGPGEIAGLRTGAAELGARALPPLERAGMRLAGINPVTGVRASETMGAGVNLGNAFEALMRRNDVAVTRAQKLAEVAMTKGDMDAADAALKQIEALSTERDRLTEIANETSQIQAQIGAMTDLAANNPLAAWASKLVARSGQFKGEIPDTIPMSQAKEMIGKTPTAVNQAGGRVPDWIAVDQVANDLGMTTDQFRREVNTQGQAAQHIAALKDRLRSLDREARQPAATGQPTAPEIPPTAPTAPVATGAALPEVGEQRPVMGINAMLSDKQEIDGVRYELWASADNLDGPAVLRATDMGTGNVIPDGMTKYPDYASAQQQYTQTVNTAQKIAGTGGAPTPTAPQPVENPNVLLGEQSGLFGGGKPRYAGGGEKQKGLDLTAGEPAPPAPVPGSRTITPEEWAAINQKGALSDEERQRLLTEGNATMDLSGTAAPIPTQVQRIEEPGAITDMGKPHGLYTTPVDVTSPHADLGGTTTTLNVNPDANVLTIPNADANDRALAMRPGAINAGTGVHAAYQLLGADEFNRLRALPKDQLIAEAMKIDPNVDWSRYFDAQEVMEGIGGSLARQQGYDAIWMPSKADPAFSEYVGLTDKAFRGETGGITPPAPAPAPEPAAPNPLVNPEQRPVAENFVSGNLGLFGDGPAGLAVYNDHNLVYRNPAGKPIASMLLSSDGKSIENLVADPSAGLLRGRAVAGLLQEAERRGVTGVSTSVTEDAQRLIDAYQTGRLQTTVRALPETGLTARWETGNRVTGATVGQYASEAEARAAAAADPALVVTKIEEAAPASAPTAAPTTTPPPTSAPVDTSPFAPEASKLGSDPAFEAKLADAHRANEAALNQYGAGTPEFEAANAHVWDLMSEALDRGYSPTDFEEMRSNALSEPTPATTATTPATVASSLPPALAGAKPNYGYGRALYSVNFESDVDKALYIVGQEKKSARDADYLTWLRQQFPGMTDNDLRVAGVSLRDDIKNLAQQQYTAGTTSGALDLADTGFGQSRAAATTTNPTAAPMAEPQGSQTRVGTPAPAPAEPTAPPATPAAAPPVEQGMVRLYRSDPKPGDRGPETTFNASHRADPNLNYIRDWRDANAPTSDIYYIDVPGQDSFGRGPGDAGFDPTDLSNTSPNITAEQRAAMKPLPGGEGTPAPATTPATVAPTAPPTPAPAVTLTQAPAPAPLAPGAQTTLPGIAPGTTPPARTPGATPPTPTAGPVAPALKPNQYWPRVASSQEWQNYFTKSTILRRTGEILGKLPGGRQAVQTAAGASAIIRDQIDRAGTLLSTLDSLSQSGAAAGIAHLRPEMPNFVIKDGLVTNVPGTPVVGDMIERLPQYRAVMTPAQIKAVELMHAMVDDLRALARQNGIKFSDLGFAPGEHYFPRQVVNKTTAAGDVYEKAAGGTMKGRAVGSAASFQKTRLHDTMEEGMRNGITYNDNPLAVLEASAKATYRLIAEKRFAAFVKSMAIRMPKGASASLTTGRVNAPAFNNLIFDAKVADHLNSLLADQKWSGLWNPVEKTTGLLKAVEAAVDLSATGIQLLPVLGRDVVQAGGALLHGHKPAFIYPQAVAAQVKVLRDPVWGSRYLRDNADVVQEAVQHGITIGESDYFTREADTLPSLVTQQIQQRLPGRLGTIASAPSRFAQAAVDRSGEAYNTALNVAKIEMWKALRPGAKNADELHQLGDSINRITGSLSSRKIGIGPNQRAFESTVGLFAPGYTRAWAALVGSIANGDLAGREALKSLSGMGASLTAAYVAAALASGQEPNVNPMTAGQRPEPGKNKFFGLHTGEGTSRTDFTMGGLFFANLRLMGTLAAIGSRQVSDPNADFNLTAQQTREAVGSAYRSRTGIVGRWLWDLNSGKDFMGQPIDMSLPGLAGYFAKQALPFGIANFLDKNAPGVETAPISALGINASPASPGLAVSEMMDKASRQQYGIPAAQMNRDQREQLLKANPNIAGVQEAARARSEQTATDPKIVATNGLFSATKDLTQKAETTLKPVYDQFSKWPAAGTQVDGKQFREARSAALAQKANGIDALKTTTYKDALVDPAERAAYYKKLGVDLPQQQELDTLGDKYYGLEPQTDPETGLALTRSFYQAQDKMLASMTPEQRDYVLYKYPTQRFQDPVMNKVEFQYQVDKQRMKPYFDTLDKSVDNIGMRPFLDAYEKADVQTRKRLRDFDPRWGLIAKIRQQTSDLYRLQHRDVDQLLQKYGYKENLVVGGKGLPLQAPAPSLVPAGAR